jgi:hypothetical protein
VTTQPNLTYYTNVFIPDVMGIDTTILPADSTVISISYQIALMFVNQALLCVPGPPQCFAPTPETTLTVYALAVYNLAGDRLLNFAQDLPSAAIIDGSQPPMPFFAWTRKQFNLNGFVSGAITASSDNGTSASFDVPDWAKKLTVSQLSNLQTPYGRQYLGIAQAYGPSIVGLSRGVW